MSYENDRIKAGAETAHWIHHLNPTKAKETKTKSHTLLETSAKLLIHRLLKTISISRLRPPWQTGGLYNRNIFLRTLEAESPPSKVSSGLVAPEASPWLMDGHLLTVSSCGLSSVHVIPGVFSSPDKDTSPVGLGPQAYGLI